MDCLMKPPLHLAVHACNKEIVQQLLEAGCDVNAKDKFGKQAIDFVLHQYDATRFIDNYCNPTKREILKLLCAHGVGLDFNNKKGTKILHSACKSGLFDLVKFLVKYNVNLFSIDDDGSTALHKAVLGNNVSLVDYLLHNGLDVNAKDKNRETPLHRMAVFNHHSDFDNISESIDEKIKTHVDIMEFIVDNGADVNAYDKNSVAPLEKSIYLNLLEISESLLELKASTEFRQDVILFAFQFNARNRKFNSTEIDTLKLLTAFLAIQKESISQYIDAISDVSKFKWILPFFNQCRNEINQMKQRNICKGRNITIYDVLGKNLEEVTNFCKNEQMMLSLEAIDYGKEFPSYKYLFEKRIERIRLLTTGRNIIIQFFEKFFRKQLPIVVVDKIFSLLKIVDVRNFGRALLMSKSDPDENYACLKNF